MRKALGWLAFVVSIAAITVAGNAIWALVAAEDRGTHFEDTLGPVRDYLDAAPVLSPHNARYGGVVIETSYRPASWFEPSDSHMKVTLYTPNHVSTASPTYEKHTVWVYDDPGRVHDSIRVGDYVAVLNAPRDPLGTEIVPADAVVRIRGSVAVVPDVQ